MKAGRPPAFQFYAKDWISSSAVTSMTPSQCGYYINLLARAWDSDRPGHLPNDPDILWKFARAESRDQFDRESGLVLAQFKLSRDGSLFNARLIRERRVQIMHQKQKSVAGKAGAKSKWLNKKDGTATILPMAENGSASAFAFASSSASASANLNQSQTPAATPAADSPKRSRTPDEQKQNIEAKEHRIRKEAETHREINVGKGPSDFMDQIHTIAKSKTL